MHEGAGLTARVSDLDGGPVRCTWSKIPPLPAAQDPVVIGTTLGMMVANVPAVLLGEAATRHVPLRIIRGVAAGLFGALGLYVLVFG